MKAKVIFINEKELQATNNQFALASTVCNEHFDKVYVSLDDVVDFVQVTQDACAEDMIKMQEQAAEKDQSADTTVFQAQWRMCNWILSELKKYQNK